MRADYGVVLDACVLIPMPLADTLLRMAETPRLFLPRWSDLIMVEVTRNLTAKWGMPVEKARKREDEIRRHFPEAWVEGFQPLIGVMTQSSWSNVTYWQRQCVLTPQLIVRYNRRHFPVDSV